MKINIDDVIDLVFDEEKIEKKIINDEMGLFVAAEWKRLIDPYTPRLTSNLMNNTELVPYGIWYRSPYAAAVYFNKRGAKFVQKGVGRNPYATDHWDAAAEKAGQKDKLYKAINEKLQK